MAQYLQLITQFDWDSLNLAFASSYFATPDDDTGVFSRTRRATSQTYCHAPAASWWIQGPVVDAHRKKRPPFAAAHPAVLINQTIKGILQQVFSSLPVKVANSVSPICLTSGSSLRLRRNSLLISVWTSSNSLIFGNMRLISSGFSIWLVTSFL